MIPTVVYPALHGAAPVAAIVGTRIYRDFAGNAPTAPYIVWSLPATVPELNLSWGPPPTDRYSVSVDVFALTEAQSDALVVAARDAMEAIGHVLTIQSLGREPDTGLWRYTFDTDVFHNR